jgi:hypothetical protein
MSVSGDNRSTPVDSSSDHEVEKVEIQQTEKVLDDADLLNDAFAGENKEHEMGVWEAAKQHPWACLWAFTMCFTIVSRTLVLSIFHCCPASSFYHPFDP